MPRKRWSATTFLALSLALVTCVPLAAAPETATPRVALKDPDGRVVDPFLAAENSRAIVFLFASVDCPVSNRYAPEVRRLHDTFAPQNVAFWLVYPNPGDTPDAVRDHLQSFAYPVHALLDPRHELVKLTNVSITPEAAVFTGNRTLAYHGRIDDRFVSLGVERPAATTRDLFNALTAVVAGRAPEHASAPAVGCFIADFVQ
jgi:AhpC/TSA family protein